MIYLSTRTSYSGSHSTLNAAERMERRAEASYYFAPLDFRSASIRHDTVKSTPFGLSNRGVYRISEVVVRMGCTIPRGYFYPVVGLFSPGRIRSAVQPVNSAQGYIYGTWLDRGFSQESRQERGYGDDLRCDALDGRWERQ